MRAGLRRPGLSALERRRATSAGVASRPHLGGDQRDPAADRRARPRAPRRGAHTPLALSERPRSPDPTPLLEPRSIAVVGANDRPGSYADIVLRNLERAG